MSTYANNVPSQRVRGSSGMKPPSQPISLPTHPTVSQEPIMEAPIAPVPVSPPIEAPEMPMPYMQHPCMQQPQMAAPCSPCMYSMMNGPMGSMNPMMPGQMGPMSPMMNGPMGSMNPMMPGQMGMGQMGMNPMCPYMGMQNMMGQWPMGFPEDMDDSDMLDYPMSKAAGDPPPILSNNPATASLELFKELTGYPNYGNPSGNADILYTGNRGDWTFNLPVNVPMLGIVRGQLVIRAVLDDHTAVPMNRYSATITVNGVTVHTGPVPLQHGTPAGGRFTNWRELTFPITNIRRNNRIRIVNTSNVGLNDWIGLDWMLMRFMQ